MAKEKEVFIRSYNDYAHTFQTSTGVVEIPSKWKRPKNIATITQDQYEELSKQEIFSVLLSSKNGGFKKLDAMPRDALDAQEKLSNAQDEAVKARAEALNAKLEADKAKEEIERLKVQLEADGGANDIVDAAKAEAEEAKNQLAEALAELAELKAKTSIGSSAPDPKGGDFASNDEPDTETAEEK